MIRAFDWRDVGLLRQLADQGVCFDAAVRLTQGNHPLQHAIFAYLLPGRIAPTLVWRPQKRAQHQLVFGQIRHQVGESQARLLFITPAYNAEHPGWLPILERLAEVAGKRRAHNLLAETAEESAECEVLRTAGFAVYARQTIWQAPPNVVFPQVLPPAGLRPATAEDAINITTLYHNLVPRLVQQVEPLPAEMNGGYVLESAQEIRAYISVRPGPLGVWVEPFFHPEAHQQQAAAVLWAALAQILQPEKALYVCVRRYQDWVADLLADTGFINLGAQAMLVKRLAVRDHAFVPAPLPAAENTLPTPALNLHAPRPQDKITPVR